MEGTIYRYSGRCHCGAIRATLVLTEPAEALRLRSCQCGFCTRHGAATIGDPEGHVTLTGDDDAVSTYSVGGGNVHTLICSRGGVYAAAILVDDGRILSIVNVRGLGMREFADSACDAVHDEREDPSVKLARRRSTYMPTDVSFRRVLRVAGFLGRA